MGLRGKKPVAFRPHQKRVWRAYLLCKALGYWSDVAREGGQLHKAVAARVGLTVSQVNGLLSDTKPIGCYDT